MGKYKFLLTSKWLGYFVVACVFAAVSVGLGMWQWDRKVQTDDLVNLINRNYSATPAPFAQLAPQFTSMNPDAQWKQVKITGSYDLAGQRLVRNRPQNGFPGFEVVVPFTVAGGGPTVIIDRGWLALGTLANGVPNSIPEPASGTVTVVARIFPSEAPVSRGAPAGQLANVDLGRYQSQLHYPILTGAYGQMVSESPLPAVVPQSFPAPSIDDGTHLSYALQWYAFAVLGFVGLGYAARQQLRNDEYAEQEATELGIPVEEVYGNSSAFAQHVRKVPKRRKPGAAPTPEEIEDALLDAQGFQVEPSTLIR